MSTYKSWLRWMPVIFVLIWSTGFIAAKFALPYIEPYTLLFLRKLITLALILVLIMWLRAPWPGTRQAMHQMVVGTLIHTAYLGGVFTSINLGMPAGMTSLIVSLQPILTAVLAFILFQHSLLSRQWVGLGLGLLGVSLVISQSRQIGFSEINAGSLLAVFIALVGISLGTVYQKHFGQNTHLLTGSFYQFLATAIWMGLLSFALESQQIMWSFPLIASLAWMVVLLSIISILLLMLMIRRGETARVASYFYLVPPVVAVQGWLFFDEQLNLMALAGIALTVAGVYLVIKATGGKAAG